MIGDDPVVSNYVYRLYVVFFLSEIVLHAQIKLIGLKSNNFKRFFISRAIKWECIRMPENICLDIACHRYIDRFSVTNN